jgi:hypothetical protein
MAAYISRTTATSFTSQQKFTASMWVKGDTPPPADVYWWSIGSSGAHITIYAAADGGINVIGAGPSAAWYQYATVRLKDPAAWYHVVLSVDTTQSVANDRIKLYINGTLYADDAYWNSRSYPAEDDELTGLVSGKIQYISSNYGASGREIKQGLMSHVHYCDGYNYTASDFGETDSTSGIWKIKTSPSVTYGNNGYFLKMEDRTNLDLDSGTNAFTFTTTGTLTPTYDNPSNNFCTMNPLDNYYAASDFTNGNTTVQTGTSSYTMNTATLGMVGGKWYWECKIVADTASGDEFQHGITDIVSTATTIQLGDTAFSYCYRTDNGNKDNDGGSESYGDTATIGDIISVALDLDNLKIYFAKNGTWQDSGDPTSGATGTGAAFTVTAPALTTGGQYLPANGEGTGVARLTYGFNFGNGYFGTTAVASTNADDAGIGSFEYDVPTGYYTLCTKNIKAYGG